ncbi:MAG: agmatine deiminase family protein, partial [Bacteroidota bacterium]
MKKISLIVIGLLYISLSFLQAQEVPKWKKMHYLSEAEMYLPHDNAKNFTPTDPPEHPVRMVAEFENMQSVLVRYPFGIPTSLIVEMSQDCGVTTIVASQSQQNTVTNIYQGNGANMDNIDFIQAPTDSYWTRDYGPWFVIDGNGDFGVCDFPYNRPRPADDEIPVEVANYLGINLFGMPLEHTGGNWMCTGETQGASTDLVWEENLSMSHQEIQDMVTDYLGIDQYHVLPDPLGEYIKHIDCWGKFLGVNKVLIGSVAENDPRYDDFEFVADYFAGTISDWGVPYEVHRVFTPGNYPNTPYTNSLILNEKVFVPITGSTHDGDALAAYEDAMPGYEIIGIMYNGWENTDALHCRTKGIADIGLLYIDHTPLLGNVQMQDEYNITASITPYSGTSLTADSLLVYYQVDGGPFEPVLMSQQIGSLYTGTIPFQDEGSVVGYYIHAADDSGQSMNHPYIGAPDPHEFNVMQLLPGLHVNPDTLLFTTFTQAFEGLEVMIYPADGEDVIIDHINMESYDPFAWWAEPAMTFPYLLPADDSLMLTIRIDIPTDQSLGFVQDTMLIECEAGNHEVFIIVDEDIISSVSEKSSAPLISNLYPNPFDNKINFLISMPEKISATAYILDLRGNMIRAIEEGVYKAGDNRLRWDGRNQAGITCPAGIYYLVIQTDQGRSSG